MARFLKDAVVVLKMINVYLILIGWWINTTVTQAMNPQTWLMVGNDSYRRYQCTTTSAGILSPIVCSHSCCTQHRCIGMFFNELSSECLLINAVDKTNPCDNLNWANWQPYRKSKESIDTCNDYLMHSGDYTYVLPGDGHFRSVLYYTPVSNSDVGGLALVDQTMQNTVTFEANVIPDAGNEVVVNLFDMPVTGKCFSFYSVDYHLHNVIRYDLIGCGIN